LINPKQAIRYRMAAQISLNPLTRLVGGEFGRHVFQFYAVLRAINPFDTTWVWSSIPMYLSYLPQQEWRRVAIMLGIYNANK
jgi:hypothetical protein